MVLIKTKKVIYYFKWKDKKKLQTSSVAYPSSQIQKVFTKKCLYNKAFKNLDALLSIHSLESTENLPFYLAQKQKGPHTF